MDLNTLCENLHKNSGQMKTFPEKKLEIATCVQTYPMYQNQIENNRFINKLGTTLRHILQLTRVTLFTGQLKNKYSNHKLVIFCLI